MGKRLDVLGAVRWVDALFSRDNSCCKLSTPGNISRPKISKKRLEIYLDATIKSKYCSKYNNLPSGHVNWRFTRYSTFVLLRTL